MATSSPSPDAISSADTVAAPKRQGRSAKRVNLALQGGGAHGAFTWGVLDRLIEDTGIEVDSICGTSAGAMNAAVFASSYAADGRAGARRALPRSGGASPMPAG
jgi:NTE family protein